MTAKQMFIMFVIIVGVMVIPFLSNGTGSKIHLDEDIKLEVGTDLNVVKELPVQTQSEVLTIEMESNKSNYDVAQSVDALDVLMQQVQDLSKEVNATVVKAVEQNVTVSIKPTVDVIEEMTERQIRVEKAIQFLKLGGKTYEDK